MYHVSIITNTQVHCLITLFYLLIMVKVSYKNMPNKLEGLIIVWFITFYLQYPQGFNSENNKLHAG